MQVLPGDIHPKKRKGKKMTTEQECLTNDFTEYEKIRGIKIFRKLKYELKPFFEYITEAKLNSQA